MKKGSKSVSDPQKLASELEQLRELNSLTAFLAGASNIRL